MLLVSGNQRFTGKKVMVYYICIPLSFTAITLYTDNDMTLETDLHFLYRVNVTLCRLGSYLPRVMQDQAIALRVMNGKAAGM